MIRITLILGSFALLAGCVHVKVDPIQLNIQQDVNIKLDQQLDDFFAFQDKAAATQPATTQTGAMQ